MGKKRYDPLWELVDEKVVLQGQEADVDVACPHCHVTVHLGLGTTPGDRYACGLCGGVSRVAQDGAGLEREPEEES